MNAPLHPLIVHFPIALLSLAAIVQILALWKPRLFDWPATGLLAVGFISGIFAYITGDGGEHYAKNVFGATEDMIHRHENMAFLALLFFGILLALKVLIQLPWTKEHFGKNIRWMMPLLPIISLAGLVLIYYTGHYGGQIVYHGGTEALGQTLK
ncbi:DUF2231 domain-containing protein [Paenibacillus sp.]|jgi:uncharacterized membrane protein|uniref:DUF2231 domain-containing protein n=1 Tax=Paenibacillus sp. TaxID=58172 RepID=UPI00281B6033|nr:DUF2231 domain-containing protein [Paenibacillus sp.]MDR0269791.1 hypothetical protein [Paenibacillus sp.]